MSRLVVFLCALLSCATILTAQQGAMKSEDLKILFVGHDPEAPRIPFGRDASERTRALFRERTGAFEALLRYHFKSVRIVYAADYKVEMSDDADVTIFDALPTPIAKAKRERNPETGEIDYQPARYLPDSFDRATLAISDNTPRLGEPMGVKLDWL